MATAFLANHGHSMPVWSSETRGIDLAHVETDLAETGMGSNVVQDEQRSDDQNEATHLDTLDCAEGLLVDPSVANRVETVAFQHQAVLACKHGTVQARVHL